MADNVAPALGNQRMVLQGLPQRLRHRNAGIQVPARAPAGQQDSGAVTHGELGVPGPESGV